jgi:hypothetical protein
MHNFRTIMVDMVAELAQEACIKIARPRELLSGLADGLSLALVPEAW